MEKRVRRLIGLGVAGALVAMALGPAAFGATASAEKTTATTWSLASDCTVCHVHEEVSCDDEKALASKHAVLTCTDCHTDEKGLTKAHKKAKEGTAQAKRLKKSEVPPETCLTCHTQEDLVKATAKVEVLTDTEGTTVNPHDLPAVVEHEGVSCASCHYMHRDKDALEAAPAVCNGCHHDGVYECFTCHA